MAFNQSLFWTGWHKHGCPCKCSIRAWCPDPFRGDSDELEHKGLDSAGGTQSKFMGFQSLHNSFVEVTFMSSKMRYVHLNPKVESMVWAKRASNCSIIEKIPPKGVSFSDFICIFAMSFRVLFVF